MSQIKTLQRSQKCTVFMEVYKSETGATVGKIIISSPAEFAYLQINFMVISS